MVAGVVGGHQAIPCYNSGRGHLVTHVVKRHSTVVNTAGEGFCSVTGSGEPREVARRAFGASSRSGEASEGLVERLWPHYACRRNGCRQRWGCGQHIVTSAWATSRPRATSMARRKRA